MSTPIAVGAGTLLMAGASITVSGLGFQPKALYLCHVSSGSSQLVSTSYFFSQGFAGESGQFSHRVLAFDNVSPTSCQHSTNTNKVADDGSGVTASVTYTSDGFTLTWNAPTNCLMFYLAIGGSGIGAVAGSFDLPTVGATYSVSGIGITPTMLMLINCGSLASGDATMGTGLTNGSAQRALCFRDRNNVSPSNVQSSYATDAVIIGANGGADYKASLASLDAGGFTLNMDVLPAAADVKIGYLAISGVSAQVGSFQQPAATGAQSIDAGIGPGCVLMFPTNLTAAAAGTRANGFVGAAGLTQLTSLACGAASDDSANPSSTARGLQDAEPGLIFNGTPTRLGRANTGSLTGVGFDLNWNVCDGTQRQIAYLAMQRSQNRLLPVLGCGT